MTEGSEVRHRHSCWRQACHLVSQQYFLGLATGWGHSGDQNRPNSLSSGATGWGWGDKISTTPKTQDSGKQWRSHGLGVEVTGAEALDRTERFWQGDSRHATSKLPTGLPGGPGQGPHLPPCCSHLARSVSFTDPTSLIPKITWPNLPPG